MDSTGPNNFFLGDGGVGLDPAEDGRLDVVTLGQACGRIRAAGEQLRAAFDAFPDVAAHALALRLRHQRSELGRAAEGVADGETFGHFDRDFRRLVVFALWHQQARVRRAGLA